MKWYSAHTIIGFQRSDRSGSIIVYENIHLISANESNIALEKANAISKLEIESSSGFCIDGIPAPCVYGAVRKIVAISNLTPPQDEKPPEDGTELTYIEYEIESVEMLKNIIQGNSVVVNLVD